MVDRGGTPEREPFTSIRRRRIRPVPGTAFAALIVAVGFAAFERIGTHANVDIIEFTPNLAGGFLALGSTQQQPGFLLLSAHDRAGVSLEAARHTHLLAGTHTELRVATPTDSWTARLRDPVVITVDDTGHIRAEAVDWTWAMFQELAASTDCRPAHGVTHRRCGALFHHLRLCLAGWSRGAVPCQVRSFLANH